MVIVNADDFGFSSEVNKAIGKCFRDKIISSTTLMTNMPYSKEAALLAIDNGFKDFVGLHFNLIEGEPLTEGIKGCPRLCKNGLLSYKRNSVWIWSEKEKRAIKEEFLAQYERMIELGLTPSHVDSHQHSLTELPIYTCLRDVIKDININKIRLSRNIGLSKSHMIYKKIFNMIYRMDGLKTTDYFNIFFDTKNNLALDNIEIMCHPTLDYDGKVVDAFEKREIKRLYNDLCSYRDL